MTFLRNLWNEDQGQDLVEYTLLMAFVALASAALFIGAGRVGIQDRRPCSAASVRASHRRGRGWRGLSPSALSVPASRQLTMSRSCLWLADVSTRVVSPAFPTEALPPR